MTGRRGVDYDQDAGEYAAHRKIHAGVFAELAGRGGLGPGSRVLEVGCGTGNYLGVLAGRLACTAFGLDPACAMLAQASMAQASTAHACWLQGRAEELPFAGGGLDMIFSVDVIHHVRDRAGFFEGVARCLRPGGRVCTVTDSPEIIRRREVLSGYFPETVEIELARYPQIEQLAVWMAQAGLTETQVTLAEQPYEIDSAAPFRDRAFSSLHLISEAAWRAGLARLEADVARGPVRGVSRYACVWGKKAG